VTFVLSLLLAATAPASYSAVEAPALHITRGSVTRRQVVALGRDLLVDGTALSDVAALDGSVRVTGTVEGDVIVLGGDAFLEPTSNVAGDIFVLGGVLTIQPGAVIEGRCVSYPTAPQAWLVLLEGPSLGLPASAVLATKLGLLAAWLATLLLLFATGRAAVLRTAASVRREPFRNFLLGLTGVAALMLTVLFLSAITAPLLGIPLLVLLAVVAMVLKLWGMVAVFHASGDWVLARLRRQVPVRLSDLARATLGLAVLGSIKLLPWVGLWVWTVATFVAVGAALATRLGMHDVWLDEPRPQRLFDALTP
jgi:cytoskeletal protein CcmA (bactofilin family)